MSKALLGNVVSAIFALTIVGSETICLANEVVTSSSERIGKFDKYTFKFSSKGDMFTIRYDGCGVVEGMTERIEFKLELPETFTIYELSYLRVDRDLVLVYLLGSGIGGSGRICRLNGNTLLPKWEANVMGFNLGEAVARGGFLYLSAINLVAKLDLHSGRFVWMHEKLDQMFPSAFNSFQRPILRGPNVLFTEVLPPYASGSAITIVVEDETGRIVQPSSQ
jgi:hypothetical protein